LLAAEEEQEEQEGQQTLSLLAQAFVSFLFVTNQVYSLPTQLLGTS
jgi:hypothetical protein